MADENVSVEGTTADLLLAECEKTLLPLAKLLVSHGVGYPQLAARLKLVFIEAARRELQSNGAKATDAAISVSSGVHRKDVRTWREEDSDIAAHKEFSVTDQIYTKWLTDAAYKDTEGKPKAIPVTGPAPSFDALAASITKDFHRRTLLDDLQRLGLVQLTSPQSQHASGPETAWVVPLADGLVPKENLTELMRFFSSNNRDHMSASVENIIAVQHGAPPPFIERSVFAHGLAAQSVDQLGQLARQLWQPAFQQMVDAANQRYSVDKEVVGHASAQRMRFGVYFYSEPEFCPMLLKAEQEKNGAEK
jgi:Family of unknown function (DUF6502)